tara:strand:- start:420 stop:1247 length:828 start_codon:yes stop_codon:yes gene_type:complete
MKLDPYINFSELKLNYKNSISPRGKVALVTGGTGRIGSIFVSIFLLNDFKVIIASRLKKKFKQFSNSLPQQYRKNLYWVKLDLLKPDLSIKQIKKLNKKFEIDYLVNNAASHYRGKNIDYTSKNIQKEFFGLIGTSILITEEVLKNMRKRKNGNIINVGSIWGISAPKFDTYLEMDIAPSLMTSICKAGMSHFSKYLTARESGYNININTLSPGWFPRKGKKSRNDYMKMITKDIPQKRIGNLTDLVSVINFLISTGSKYFTGQTVKIDGGHSVW